MAAGMMKSYLFYLKQVKILIAFLIANGSFNPLQAQLSTVNNKPSITVDLTKSIGPMYPAWAWFGYDEPN